MIGRNKKRIGEERGEDIGEERRIGEEREDMQDARSFFPTYLCTLVLLGMLLISLLHTVLDGGPR